MDISVHYYNKKKMQETKVYIPSRHQGVFKNSGAPEKKFYKNKWFWFGFGAFTFASVGLGFGIDALVKEHDNDDHGHTSSNVDLMVGGDMECPKGYYIDTTLETITCQPCNAGTYSGQTGATSETACQKCPQGRGSVPASTDCFTGCSEGTYLEGGTCVACPPGSGSLPNSTNCTKYKSCPTGKFLKVATVDFIIKIPRILYYFFFFIMMRFKFTFNF